MPLADTGIVSAQAVERSLATPETDAAQQPDDAQETAPAAPDETTEQTEGGATTPAPDEDTNAAEPEAAQPAQPRAQAAPLAAPTGPALTWTVADENGALVSGATVKLAGPEVRTWAGRYEWRDSFTVTDCTSAPCAPTSMDQDPRPGVFLVDRTVTGNSVQIFTADAKYQRFQITPMGAPSLYTWVSQGAIAIPGSAGKPSQSPWKTNQWDFGRLLLNSADITCTPGDVYSVSSAGQLQHLQVKDKNATLRNVGTSARVSGFNGLGIGPGDNSVYAYSRSSNGKTGNVYQYDAETGEWSALRGGSFNASGPNAAQSLVGGAVDPDGVYWAGGFSSYSRYFQLWKLDNGKMAMWGHVDLSAFSTSDSGGANGDIAFDSEGNLYIVRGAGTDLTVFRVDASRLDQTGTIGGAAVVTRATSGFTDINGIAYGADGKLYVGSKNQLAFRAADAGVGSNSFQSIALPDNKLDTTDLASCGYPPTLRVVKDLPDGRANASDQFLIGAKVGQTVITPVATSGQASGEQAPSLGPIPIGTGVKVSISEAPANRTTNLANYAASWACSVDGVPLSSGTGTVSSEFTIPDDAHGKKVLCVIKNSLMQVSKTASVASGTAVDAGQRIDYTLTFDNSGGASAALVNYRDYLADVLDDATFVKADGSVSATPVITSTVGLTTDWSADKHWLTIGGTVKANSVGTIKYSVKVKSNSDEAQKRADGMTTEGFIVRNMLARGTSETPPSECQPGMCTEHPINSWTVDKDSLPADTARLHKGGNVHYKVTATKTNADTTLRGLVLQDDLTHVFKTAGWAPEAAVPGGAQKMGVYLFNSDGRTINLDGQPNTDSMDTLRSVRDVAAPTQVNVAPNGAPADLRWIVTSGAPLDLPKEAERAEMWFAVQAAESPVGIPAASTWEGQGNTPTTGWKFVNYATGMAKSGSGATTKDFAPNACVTGKNVPNTALAPNSAQPVDVNFPEQCRVQHELSQNYFTIRKDAGGAGVQALADDKAWDPDPTGLWNMIGHEFEVRDNDKATGKATSYPSVQLCRTDYDPEKGWRGEWISPAIAGDKSRWDFSTENSATAKKILDWNNAHPDEADQLPVCGTLYEISDGGQKGRWRSENLNAGDYWLVETKAPNAQTDANAEKTRPVPGVQKLAQPVPFKIWPEEDGTSLGGPAMQGRGQLDVGNGSGKYLDRCNPGQQKPGGEFEPGGTIAERPTACVNPTGYLLLVKDPAPVPLPLTGGQWLPMVLGGGAAVLFVALAGALWWRRRRTNPSAPVGRHGA
ncbi:hypothetical protein GCM10009692_25490 [Leucobacter aridicollis]